MYKVLYQPYQYNQNVKIGPFRYIETGYIRGLAKAGAEVLVWDGLNIDFLRKALEHFSPTLFIGYLRGGSSCQYKTFEWTNCHAYDLLASYRKSTGMMVALHTHPDVQKMKSKFNLTLSFSKNDVSCADMFYNQLVPPLPAEKRMVNDNFVDVILHSFSKEVSKHCFTFWKDKNVIVLEEPLAADVACYRPNRLYRPEWIDISYIGGWWPFKGIQIDKYVQYIDKHYKKHIRIYGRNWPYLSRGLVSDRKYKELIWASKINLVLHEPSQIQGYPIHVNERIFKIYAMRQFALCDDNPCLREYFNENEIVLCASPEEMLDKCKFYLNPRNAHIRKQYCIRGYHAIKSRHTYMHRAKNLFKTLVTLQ